MTHLDFLSSSRKVDAKGRLALKKDCDEVYPQIIIGTGDCIKDVSDQLYLFIYIKGNYRDNYILGNDHGFFYFNYPDLSPVYDK